MDVIGRAKQDARAEEQYIRDVQDEPYLGNAGAISNGVPAHRETIFPFNTSIIPSLFSK